MEQYERIKEQHPDALLLFRVGDFYETFGTDAITASQVLGIVLTKRANGSASHIELAGFPHHSLDSYLPKLIRAGFRVAICDQLEDPKATKKIVKRGVTEVVTPGVSFNDQVLDPRSNNFLACVVPGGSRYGAAFVDVTTGEFYLGQGNDEEISKLIEAHDIKELIYPRDHSDRFLAQLCGRQYSFGLDDWVLKEDHAIPVLHKHFGTKSFKGYGVADMKMALIAAGAIIQYLNDTRHGELAHIDKMSRLRSDEHVWLDRFTVRNLELLEGVDHGAQTLLSVLDECITPMGARCLQRWMLFPLVDPEVITVRHDRVQALIDNEKLQDACEQHLKEIGDLERIVAKASTGKVNPREVVQLAGSLESSFNLQQFILEQGGPLSFLMNNLKVPMGLVERIRSSMNDEPPVNLTKGGVIRDGVNKELDEYRHVSSNAKDLLLQLQQREMEATGISSLKVGYNNVFGYYLEVRNTHKDKVPVEWTRKQTLVSAERYVTEELKNLEEQILSAEERILLLESDVFNELVQAIRNQLVAVQSTASVISALDVLFSFAQCARQYDYCRPALTEGMVLEIEEGRHPVIERQLVAGEKYVANSVRLDPENEQIWMITGPNMSGKSALLRQTALIVLMAQMGSFVPARSVRMGVFDRVFTRVGASDNLSTGESTFMVEMNETASILNNLSDRSLLLMDEIGRGTSTYDGISIAWAITEFLHEHPARPRTLFATHYHELNDMAATFPRIRNGNVAVKEVGGKVIFLRKLIPGGSDRSFGIHVAEMAGMPQLVVKRAEKVLAYMEESRKDGVDGDHAITPEREMQLSFFQLDDPILERIREEIDSIDIDRLTPVEALLKLNEIKRLSGVGKAQLKKA
jgi:DNA mismatch repair protein MutS